MSITSQSVPIFIPIVFAIIGFGLIIYFFGKIMQMRKKVSYKSLTMLVKKTQKGESGMGVFLQLGLPNLLGKNSFLKQKDS
jgi:hypothetical protein